MLDTLFNHQRANGADIVRLPVRDAWEATLALAGGAALALVLAYAASAAGRWHPLAPALLLAVAGTWHGTRLGISLPRRLADVVFARWIRILPLDDGIALAQWRRRSALAVAVHALPSVAVVGAAAAIAGLPPTQLAAVAPLSWSTACATALVVLALNPWQHAGRRTRPGRRRDRLPGLQLLEPARARHLGAWQARRKWTPWTGLVFAAGATGLMAAALAVANARQLAWPVLATALLVSVAFFNTSLDGRVLASPVARLLPLSGPQRVRVLVHPPALASLGLLLVGACSLASIGQLPRTPMPWLALGLAWLALCMARTAACLAGCGRLRTDLEYMALVLGLAMAVQGAGPVGLGAGVAATAALLVRRAARA